MKNFLLYSKKLGQLPSLVQGAGGNTSFKRDGFFTVKASGYFLSQVGKKSGYASCQINKILKLLAGLGSYSPNLESDFAAKVLATADQNKSFGQPSIEAAMHAAIPSKYVFHTHSVLANVFNFANNGQSVLRQIFSPNDFLFLNYYNPGLELAMALAKELKRLGKLPGIIFLKNHGLITHHNNAAAAYQLTMDVQRKIIGYLKKQKVYRPFIVRKTSAKLSRHMFPDSVVYSQVDFSKLSPAKKQVYYEICSMVNYTQSVMQKLNLRPVFLPAAKVKFLQNMEQEKHRINMLIKS